MERIIAALIGGTLGFLSRKKKRKSPAKKRTAPSTPTPSKPAAKKTEAKKPSEPKKRVVKREPSKPAPKRRRTRKATGESKPESKATPTPQKRKPSPKKAEPKKVGGKPTKYTSVRKAVKLIAKEEGKEVTYAKGEFLSGLYEYEKGGKLSDTHRYIKRADIVKVVLDDGTEVTNPANGYWVKK